MASLDFQEFPFPKGSPCSSRDPRLSSCSPGNASPQECPPQAGNSSGQAGRGSRVVYPHPVPVPRGSQSIKMSYFCWELPLDTGHSKSHLPAHPGKAFLPKKLSRGISPDWWHVPPEFWDGLPWISRAPLGSAPRAAPPGHSENLWEALEPPLAPKSTGLQLFKFQGFFGCTV